MSPSSWPREKVQNAFSRNSRLRRPSAVPESASGASPLRFAAVSVAIGCGDDRRPLRIVIIPAALPAANAASASIKRASPPLTTAFYVARAREMFWSPAEEGDSSSAPFRQVLRRTVSASLFQLLSCHTQSYISRRVRHDGVLLFAGPRAYSRRSGSSRIAAGKCWTSSTGLAGMAHASNPQLSLTPTSFLLE